MIFESALLLISPDFVLEFFNIKLADAVWLRVVGGIVAVLVFYYFTMAKNEITVFFKASIYGRTFEFILLSALVVFNNAPAVLALFGFMDFAGAVWTWIALKKNRRGPRKFISN